MRRLTASLAYVLAAVSTILAAQASAVTFNDGLVHVIDAGNSFPLESVIVDDAPGSAMTTVNVVAGGEVGTVVDGDLRALGNSRANVSEGEIGRNFNAEQSSQITFSGGVVGGNIAVLESSFANISSGVVIGGVIVQDDAQAIISGGQFVNSTARGAATVQISGGTFFGSGGENLAFQTSNTAVVDVLGGEFNGIVRSRLFFCSCGSAAAI